MGTPCCPGLLLSEIAVCKPSSCLETGHFDSHLVPVAYFLLYEYIHELYSFFFK